MSDIKNLKFGLRITEVRKSLNMSVEEFGKKLGISAGSLAAVEDGHRGITAKMVRKICAVTSISPDYLIFGEENLNQI